MTSKQIHAAAATAWRPTHAPAAVPARLQVLAESKGTPAFGTPADAAALLQQCLKGQL